MSNNKINIKLQGVSAAFLNDWKHKYPYLEGALGLGKTHTVILKMLALATRQKPIRKINPSTGQVEMVRPTRILVTRRNYSQLIDGIFKDAKSFIEHLSHKVYNVRDTAMPYPMIHLRFQAKDKTVIDSLWIFKPLETVDDLDKIHGTALTAAVMDEANEQNEYIFGKLSQRVGRYPSASLIDDGDDDNTTYLDKLKSELSASMTDPDSFISAVQKTSAYKLASKIADFKDEERSDDIIRDIQEQFKNYIQDEDPDNILVLDTNPIMKPISETDIDTETNVNSPTITWSGIMLTANPPPTNNWVYLRMVKNRIVRESTGEEISAYYRIPPVFKRYRSPKANMLFKHKGWYYVPNAECTAVKYNSAGITYWEEGIISCGDDDTEIQRMYMGNHTHPDTGGAVFAREFSRKDHVVPSYARGLSTEYPVNMFFDYGINSACSISQINSSGGLTFFNTLYLPDGNFNEFMATIIIPYYKTHLRNYFLYLGGDATGNNKSGKDGLSYFESLCNEFKKVGADFTTCYLTNRNPESQMNATKDAMRIYGGFEILDSNTDAIDGLDHGYVIDPRKGLPDKRDRFIKVGGKLQKLFNYSHIMDTIQDTMYVHMNHKDAINKVNEMCSEIGTKKIRELIAEEARKTGATSNYLNM